MMASLDSRQLAARLKLIRIELFGDDGSPDLARWLGLPCKTWSNYENGVTIPAEILLKFIELTSVNPHWLVTGEGPRLSLESACFEPDSQERGQISCRFFLGCSLN